MSLSAIRAVQNIQLVCFAVVFACMAAQSRGDRGLRLLFYNYLTGGVGALFGLPSMHSPVWLVTLLAFEVAQVRYAFLHLAVVSFVGRGRRTRWVGMGMALACLPFYVAWMGASGATASYALLAAAFAVQTAWTASLLLRSGEAVTRWPRTLMGLFFLLYCVMEVARFLVPVVTGHDPSVSAPWLEHLSLYMFVVASSLTPLAFVWMFHARLLGDLKRQSVMDPLTGLLNRRGFEDGWRSVCDRYRLTGRSFALAVADIDHFKRINDTYGHAEGDAVLCGVARVLQTMVRERDLAGRLGGEEFVFVLQEVTGAQAATLVERIRAALAEHSFQMGDDRVRVTASFGVTMNGEAPSPSFETLLKQADAAMYKAKEAGRNQVRLSWTGKQDPDPPREKAAERAPQAMLPARAR